MVVSVSENTIVDIKRVIIIKTVRNKVVKTYNTKTVKTVMDYIKNIDGARGVDIYNGKYDLPRKIKRGNMVLTLCWIGIEKRKD